MIDTGVDVITQVNLRDYEIRLNSQDIPHEWTTAGWEPQEDEIEQWK